MESISQFIAKLCKSGRNMGSLLIDPPPKDHPYELRYNEVVDTVVMDERKSLYFKTQDDVLQFEEDHRIEPVDEKHFISADLFVWEYGIPKLLSYGKFKLPEAPVSKK